MAMYNYEMTANDSVLKIKNKMKEDVMLDVIEFLKSKYGEDNVAFVRTGTGSVKKNEIAVRCAEISSEGFAYEGCVTINITSKEFMERVTAKSSYEPFVFNVAAEEYAIYTQEKTQRKNELEKLKSDKIKRDMQNEQVKKGKTEMVDF